MTPLHIPVPCSEDFAGMEPTGNGRRCATCTTTVVDLVSVGPDEERTLLAQLLPLVDAGQRICVHARTDHRGVLQPPSRRRRLLTNGLAGLMAMAIAGCHGSGPENVPSTTPAEAPVATPAAAATDQPAAVPASPAAVPAQPSAPTGNLPPAATTSPPVSAAPPAPGSPAPMLQAQVRTTGMLVRPPTVTPAPAATPAAATPASPADAPPAEPISPQTQTNR